MKCGYDTNPFACLSCTFPDCIRNDIKRDPIKELVEPEIKRREKYRKSYARSDERWKRKCQGLPVEPIVFKRKGREVEYQREYRASMGEEQKERYRAWQREYARAKRKKEGIA